ncbi:hypothetical protein ACS0TY_021537 [Phlomoides rotata]
MKAKIVESSRKGKLVVKPVKEFSRKEANQNVLPPLPDTKPKKKKQYIGKEVAPSGIAPVNQQHRKTSCVGKEQTLTLISDLNLKGRIDTRRKNLVRTPVLDLNQKERLHTNDAALRNTFLAFDLNQDNSSSGKEASVPARPPSFDLNKISTGDEDFPSTVESGNYEEAKRSLTRLSNDEVQNDLMLAICRNTGEGPSRVGKRKISWQDPVALRV